MGRTGTGTCSVRCPGHTAKITDLCLSARIAIPSEDAEQPLQRIEVPVHHALFERNYRVLRNRDRLGTHLPATSSDVAVTDVVDVPQIADPVFGIERMHFECSGINEKARTDKLILLVMFAKDVTHVLAEKTL